MSKVIFEEDAFKDYDASTTFDPDEEDEEIEIDEKRTSSLVYGSRYEECKEDLSPEEILKKNIKSLESQAKHSKNPMEQRQLRQKIGKLRMKLKYKDYGMF